MAIPESQLETWSKVGAAIGSKDTYATIRSALEDAKAPYASKSYSIYLQGSYCNDTNVYSESDVDVIIETDSIYYHDFYKDVSQEDRERFSNNRTEGGFSFNDFKAEVQKHLVDKFGSSVKPAQSKKAIYVEGSGNRRNADVLVAVEHRRYFSYSGPSDTNYAKGICFWTSDGAQIVNYPKQHSHNCTTKHQATKSWFKSTVRVLKNMRNRMVADGYLADGVAPSYFLEGMLYNVPNDKFVKTYENCVVEGLNWIINSDRSKLECANERYWLLNPSAPECWRSEKLQAFLDAAVKYWDDWS